jgi:hypothetical protein
MSRSSGAAVAAVVVVAWAEGAVADVILAAAVAGVTTAAAVAGVTTAAAVAGVTTAAAVAGVTTAAAVTGVMLMEVAGDTTVEVANIMAMVVGRIMPIEAIEITATTVDIAITVTMAGMAHLSSLMALTAITLVDADGYIATL